MAALNLSSGCKYLSCTLAPARQPASLLLPLANGANQTRSKSFRVCGAECRHRPSPTLAHWNFRLPCGNFWYQMSSICTGLDCIFTSRLGDCEVECLWESTWSLGAVRCIAFQPCQTLGPAGFRVGLGPPTSPTQPHVGLGRPSPISPLRYAAAAAAYSTRQPAASPSAVCRLPGARRPGALVVQPLDPVCSAMFLPGVAIMRNRPLPSVLSLRCHSGEERGGGGWICAVFIRFQMAPLLMPQTCTSPRGINIPEFKKEFIDLKRFET